VITVKCEYDSNFVKNYTDGGISLESKVKFEEHMKHCERCNRAAAGDRALLEFLSVKPEMSASSGTAAARIMARVDPNRYRRNKVAFRFKALLARHIPSPGSVAAFALLIILIAGVSLNTWIFGYLKQAVPGTTDRRAVELPIDIGTEVPVDWIDHGWASVSDDALVAELNGEGMGVAPWEVIYADPDRILFRSYASLVAYKDGHIYRAADLDSLFFDHIQGDVITEFKSGWKGRYVVMGNINHAKDLDPDFENDICMFDTDTGRYFILGRENYGYVADAWSPQGKFYAYGEKGAKSIKVFDAEQGRLYEKPVSDEQIDKVFVSDKGKVAVYTSQGNVVYLDVKAGNRSERVSTDSKLLYVDADTKSVYILVKGTLYERKIGTEWTVNNEIFTGIGEAMNINLVDNRYLAARIALDQVGVYDVDTQERRFFQVKHAETGYPMALRINPGATFIFFGEVKSYVTDGTQERSVPIPDLMSFNTRWLDENRLVYIDSPMYITRGRAGEFAITAWDIRKAKKEILFSTINEESPRQGYIGRGTRVYLEPDNNSEEVGNTLYVDSIFIDHIEKIVDGWAKVVVKDPPMDGWVKVVEVYDNPYEIPHHPEEDQIQETVTEYVNALYEGDRDKLEKLLVNQARKDLDKGLPDSFKGAKLEKIVSMKVSTVDTTTAFVVARIESDGSGYNEELTLIGGGGIWKISKTERQP
jgi:hypothetical protein